MDFLNFNCACYLSYSECGEKYGTEYFGGGRLLSFRKSTPDWHTLSGFDSRSAFEKEAYFKYELTWAFEKYCFRIVPPKYSSREKISWTRLKFLFPWNSEPSSHSPAASRKCSSKLASPDLLLFVCLLGHFFKIIRSRGLPFLGAATWWSQGRRWR